DESFRNYGRHLPLRTAVVLGGVPLGGQIRALRQKPDILVATPGRLLDLMQQGYARLDRIDMLVLDEADRMLDMGFIRDVRRIVAELPRQRQTMFFSATLPPEIAQLAADMLRDPAKVAVTPAASVSGQIAQKVLFVEQSRKRDLLADVLKGEDARRTLVFTRTKRRADRLAKQLSGHGISVDA
ncbi:MAG: DEAD/DEAH box helicase, partial [Vicinamibacterales bacterium]|nr:DEAD/DEAH box helicase [Vicinamibacterales bacterium]